MSVIEARNTESRTLGGRSLPALSEPRGRTVPLPFRHVALVVDPRQVRGFHRELATRLRRGAGVHVSFISGKCEAPVPSSVDLLLTLEGMLTRSHAKRLSARLPSDQASSPEGGDNGQPDVLIDFCGGATTSQRAFRVLYDGTAGERGLFGALLAGHMPTMEIEDSQTGHILARGVAAADNAETIVEALDHTLARAIELIVLSLKGRESISERRAPQRRSARLRDVLAFEAKMLPYAVARRLYRLCCYAPHWRVCWRRVDGPGVWESRSLAGVPWNIIPDPGFRFYADPFPFNREGKDFVFVEDLDHRTGKAVISVVPFGENGPTGPARPVLEEPWHLSYPFVFAHNGQIWMMPESTADRSLHLYRADPFPYRWVREAILLDDIEASDATMIRHDGRFWMFAATRSGCGSWSDTLSIFHAPDVFGPWAPHPGNPVLIDQATARPAGAMFKRNGTLCRPVQDCTNGYGTGIGLVEIERLDIDGYQQRRRAVLHPKPDWPGRRLHMLNRVGRLECIDGSAHSPRSRFIAKRLQQWSGRRDFPAHWPAS